MKILIVEDDRNSLKLMTHFLSRFGACDTAVDGLEAVAAVTAAYKAGTPYDLAVLDIMMPNLDGMETLQRIRAYEETTGVPPGNELKVIMVSALSGDPIRSEAYGKGCMAYICKPVDFHQLERVIHDELPMME